MKAILFICLIGLTACGKQSEPIDAGVTCASYPGPYMAVYPDNSLRKSDIAICSDGTYQVTSLDKTAPETFYGHGVVIQLMDVTNLGAVSYHFTTFNGQ